jgi:hypothetical protein
LMEALCIIGAAIPPREGRDDTARVTDNSI